MVNQLHWICGSGEYKFVQNRVEKLEQSHTLWRYMYISSKDSVADLAN